eukprot:1679676-Rhodomonas_salina.2
MLRVSPYVFKSSRDVCCDVLCSTDTGDYVCSSTAMRYVAISGMGYAATAVLVLTQTGFAAMASTDLGYAAARTFSSTLPSLST